MNNARQLPLPIRVGLRDDFESPSSNVVQASQQLSADVGLPVETVIDWLVLWEEYHAIFQDQTERMVPCMAAVVASTLQGIGMVVEEDEEWGEKLITGVTELGVGVGQAFQKRALRVFVEVNAAVTSWIPRLSWDATTQRRGILVMVSRDAGRELGGLSPAHLLPGLRGIFEATDGDLQKTSKTKVGIPRGNTHAVAEPELSPSTRFPSLKDLPNPDILLGTATPYICRVHDIAHGFGIESTHPDTISLLAQYLEHWNKRNPLDSKGNPHNRVELQESAFSNGKTYDFLTVKPWNERVPSPFRPTPMVPLALLQGQLGYKIFWVGEGMIILKRDSPFHG